MWLGALHFAYPRNVLEAPEKIFPDFPSPSSSPQPQQVQESYPRYTQVPVAGDEYLSNITIHRIHYLNQDVETSARVNSWHKSLLSWCYRCYMIQPRIAYDTSWFFAGNDHAHRRDQIVMWRRWRTWGVRFGIVHSKKIINNLLYYRSLPERSRLSPTTVHATRCEYQIFSPWPIS